MHGIKDTIYTINKRPRMFIADLRLDLLYYFLAGFLTNEKYASEKITKEFSIGFHDWVYDWAKKVDPDYSYSGKFWYRIIYDHTTDEEQAISVFYELCDGFFGQFCVDQEKE